MPGPTTETDLILHVINGNESAFKKLYILYQPLLYNHIYRITESIEITDEIIQDVFLKIWHTREALTAVNNFKAYLFTVSKNYAISFLRKHVRETTLHQKWKSEAKNVSHLRVNDDAKSDYYGLLDEAIDQLPPQQKKTYLLSRHLQLKYAEIAEQMGISKETVKKYLQLATESITIHVRKNI